jgi:hypothetical protein
VPLGGRQVHVTFGVSWLEVPIPGGKRSATPNEARAARATHPALSVQSAGPGIFNVWLVAQFFVLDFIDAVETWIGELTAVAPLGPWFVTGAGELEAGLAPRKHPEALACLADLIARASPVPATAPAVTVSGSCT